MNYNSAVLPSLPNLNFGGLSKTTKLRYGRLGKTAELSFSRLLNVITQTQTEDVRKHNNADVLLDSALKLFNIIVNLCCKLYYEVLMKSGNCIY